MTPQDLTWDPLHGVPDAQRGVYVLREEWFCTFVAESVLSEAASRDSLRVTALAAEVATENAKLLRKGYSRAVRFKALTDQFGGIKPHAITKRRASRAAKEGAA